MSMLATNAVDFARSSLLDSTNAAHVGGYLTVDVVDVDGATVATHSFECTNPAYVGWYWAVAVVSLPGQESATVSEINLLPGSHALVPDPWVPWADRIKAGDLGVGDLLPPPQDDVRLSAGFTDVDAFGTQEVDDLRALSPAAWELGLGREAVLSVQGREMAIARWNAGQTGPRAAMAKAAPAQCSTCGFLVPVGGSLGQAFGICANEFGAADGTLVAMTFGCGAHSSVRIDGHAPVPVVELAVDDQADEQSDASDLADYIATAETEGDEAGEDGTSVSNSKDQSADESSVSAWSSADNVDSDDESGTLIHTAFDEDSDEDLEDDSQDDDPDSEDDHESDFLDHLDEESDHVQMVDMQDDERGKY
jgi:hypothetical protein